MGGRIADFLGQGLASARPVAATIPGLTQPFALALYYGNDTKKLSLYDDDAVDWLEVDFAALAAIAFSVLPDVDWSTPPTNGQVFAWNTGTSKLTPTTLLYNTAEELQDAVGAMFHNGTGLTAAYNDGTGQVDIVCTITQYTDEMAMDVMAAAFAAGTHTGLTITYDDALDKYSFGVSAAYVNALADARIAAASIADLIDVHSLAGIADGDTLIWNAANSRFEKGASSGYTNEQAMDAIAAMIAAGVHDGISVSYNDAGNAISFTATTRGMLHIAQVTAQNSGPAAGAYIAHGLNTVVSNTIAGATAIPTSVVTMTIASPGVITWTAHGLANGTAIMLTTTGALPTGFTAGITYYVVGATANTFQLSLASGGAAINTSGVQSGVHTAYAAQFTLPAGTYDIDGDYSGAFSGTAGFRARLYNLTDAAEQTGTIGSSAQGNVNAERRYPLKGRFTIAGTKTFEIHVSSTGVIALFGHGVSAGLPGGVLNVFANTVIKRIA